MIAFKIISFIISIILTTKAITTDNTEKAYDYFFIAFVIFMIALLTEKIN